MVRRDMCMLWKRQAFRFQYTQCCDLSDRALKDEDEVFRFLLLTSDYSPFLIFHICFHTPCAGGRFSSTFTLVAPWVAPALSKGSSCAIRLTISPLSSNFKQQLNFCRSSFRCKIHSRCCKDQKMQFCLKRTDLTDLFRNS